LPRYNASYYNPYGEAVLSRCFWPAVFKKGGFKYFVIFVEKFGMPFILGKHRRGEDQKEIDKLADMLENMVQDAIAVIPEDAAIEIKQSPFTASSEGLYTGLINYCKFEISKAILGHSASSDSTPGKLGNEQTANEVRADIVDADKRMVVKTINTLIRWVVDVKFGEQSDYPTFGLWQEEDVDKILAERDEILSRSGVRFTKRYWLRAYGFEEDDIETAPATPANPADFAEDDMPQDQAALESFIESLPDELLQNQAEQALSVFFTKLRNQSLNYEELQESLAEIYPQMDTTQLQEFLARAIFIAETLGRGNADE
jgi:phage gp29-like protein